MLRRKHTITEALPALGPSILHPGDTVPRQGDRSHQIPYHFYVGEMGDLLVLCAPPGKFPMAAEQAEQALSNLLCFMHAQHPLPLPAPTNMVSNMLKNTWDS